MPVCVEAAEGTSNWRAAVAAKIGTALPWSTLKLNWARGPYLGKNSDFGLGRRVPALFYDNLKTENPPNSLQIL